LPATNACTNVHPVFVCLFVCFGGSLTRTIDGQHPNRKKFQISIQLLSSSCTDCHSIGVDSEAAIKKDIDIGQR
jgi:hypothetical protein